jgi:hydroxyacylglutathione hydrolase
MFDISLIPAFRDNYIWLLREGAAAAVVDPGDAAPVLEVLRRDGLALASILITHHHRDHQGGIAGLLAHSPSIKVFGPAEESITGMTDPLRGGERIRPAPLDLDLQVMAVPGHTRGHLAYYGEGRLFCGDALFGGGCGRVFEGTPRAMYDSLTRLAALPDETEVYCAHEYTEANLRFALAVEPGNRALRRRAGEVAVMRAKGLSTVPSTLAAEKATNPFLRCGEAEVAAAARARGAAEDDPVAVFAALREWKNSF